MSLNLDFTGSRSTRYSQQLDFTVALPTRYLQQQTTVAPVNSTPSISARPAQDSMEMRQQVGLLAYLSTVWNAIVSFFKNIGRCLCWWRVGTPSSSEELSVWQRQMEVNVKQGMGNINFVDLSGRVTEPGRCPALQMDRIPQIGHYSVDGFPILSPILAVKLPARQLQRFPEAIRNALSSYDANHLDIYFVIWQDMPRVLENVYQPGKRNLIYHTMAYPNAQLGETHYGDLSMGIFDAEGIQRDPGSQYQAIPFDQFGEQNVHIHPSNLGMCVSPDNARFTLPSNRAWSTFNSACKLPHGRAAAVFGVILSSDDRTPESHVLLNPLCCDRISLQEYKTGIQNSSINDNLKNRIANVLDFYH